MLTRAFLYQPEQERTNAPTTILRMHTHKCEYLLIVTMPHTCKLAKLLKEAAENLKNDQQEGAQQALDSAAKELGSIEQKMQAQDLKNMASKQIQSLTTTRSHFMLRSC